MPDHVFHTSFNGHPSQIRRTLEKTLEEVAINALSYGAGGSAIGDIAEEVEQMTIGYAELLGSEMVPSLAHMLALEYKEQGRESVTIEIHDMDAPIGHDSQVGEYDLVDPADPSYLLVDAIHSVMDEGLTHEEGLEWIEENVRRILWNGDERTLTKLRRNEEMFGYAPGDRRNLLSEPFLEGRSVVEQVVERACERFLSIVSELQPETPAP